MPLHIREDKGLTRPIVVCDYCLHEITDAADGNYQWKTDDNGAPTDGAIYFTHKHCCHKFEQTHGDVLQWAAIGLECLPVFLASNLKVDWAKAKQTAAMMGEL